MGHVRTVHIATTYTVKRIVGNAWHIIPVRKGPKNPVFFTHNYIN